MKSPTKLFAIRIFFALVLLSGFVALSAQDSDKMTINLAKTAIEKYRDYGQAEKYLNQIGTASPYRDSADFLLLEGMVNAFIADNSATPKPASYKKAIEDYEKLYSITNDVVLTDIIAELKYKYDKAVKSQKLDEEKRKQNEESLAKIDSVNRANDSTNVASMNAYNKRHVVNFYNVLHKPAWHVGLNAGLHFDYFNYAAQQTTYTETTINDTIGASSTTSISKYGKSPGIGLKFGVVCHPYISDYIAVGVHCGGEIGTTHLVFAGGGTYKRSPSSKYSNDTKYFYGNFNYGLELTAGWYWLKFLTAYDHSLRHTDLSYFEDGYNSSTTGGVQEFNKQNGRYKIMMELRHEELTFGTRLFPYSKDKLRIKNPCLLDLAYTLNRDYDFDWSGVWNYKSINGFYHGLKVKLWVESIIGLSVNVSFPKNYFRSKDEPVDFKSDKILPFIGLSLFYNGDFFGLGYK